jgi:hypothetical protein
MDELIRDFVSDKFSIYDINPALSFTIKNAFRRTYKPITIKIIGGLAGDIKLYQYKNDIFSSPIDDHSSKYIQQESKKAEEEFEDKINQCVFPNTDWFITNKGIHYYHHQYVIERSGDSDSFDAFFTLQWSCYSLYEMMNFLNYHYGKYDDIGNYQVYVQMLLIQFKDFFENYDSVQKMLDMFLKSPENRSIESSAPVIKQSPIVLLELDILLEILLPYFPNEKDITRLRAIFYKEKVSPPLFFNNLLSTLSYVFVELFSKNIVHVSKSKLAEILSLNVTFYSQKTSKTENTSKSLLIKYLNRAVT